MKYVGHIVSEKDIEPDEERVSTVLEWPQPKTREKIRQFLGFVGYYRKLKNFSK